MAYARKLVWFNLEIIMYIFYKGPSFSSFFGLVYKVLRRSDDYAKNIQEPDVSSLMRALVKMDLGALRMLQSVKEHLSCALCAERAELPEGKLDLNML